VLGELLNVEYRDTFFELPWLDGLAGKEATRRIDAEVEVVRHFDELWEKLARYVLSLGVPSGDVEDILQEVFLALFGHIMRGKPRTHLRGWVFRVAHNLALKHLRLEQRLRAKAKSHGQESMLRCDLLPDPEQQLADRQRQKRLFTVFQALAPLDRQCLFLRFEGLRYREIAETLDISLGTVANSLARSIQRLECADRK
jgi:RNA polymerase sigma-70 factor, ECF subfamily